MSIEIKNLAKKYGKNNALSSVSLTFEENKIYGLLGRNGAGKTTLLNIISNRIFASDGTVLIDGEDTSKGKNAQKSVFLMSEDNFYPASMKLKEMIKWTKKFYPDTDIEAAHSIAKRFLLDENKKFGSCSMGQRTMAKLVCAFASNAKYTFLDEPVIGLDANNREEFYKILIEQYAENPRTIVVSTHLIEEVAGALEEVIVINDGKVIKNESTEELLGSGYTVTGNKADVDEFVNDKNLFGSDEVGAIKSAYIFGQRPSELPSGLEISGMNLQKLFVKLTETEEEK